MKLAFTVATPDTADSTILALRGGLEENFRFLADLGYRGVDLMLRDPNRLDAARIRSLAQEAGIRIIAVSTGQVSKEDALSLCHPDQSIQKKTVLRTRQIIDFAAAFPAPVNIGTLRGKLAEKTRDQQLQAARENLAELLEHAQSRQVQIALEPQNRYVINWLNTVEETLHWMEQFSTSNLSLLFDVYHAILEERSVYAGLIRAFPRLSEIQVSDSNRRIPGDGQFNFAELVRILRALDYQGYVTVEALPRPSAEEAARRAARYLKRLLRD
ncbi:MAG: sugar phosphate isomerase/epimerase family protein [Acidobacteriota bacterium]